jgi:hypothetical protein
MRSRKLETEEPKREMHRNGERRVVTGHGGSERVVLAWRSVNRHLVCLASYDFS